jgi:hypothetical protein
MQQSAARTNMDYKLKQKTAIRIEVTVAKRYSLRLGTKDRPREDGGRQFGTQRPDAARKHWQI